MRSAFSSNKTMFGLNSTAQPQQQQQMLQTEQTQQPRPRSNSLPYVGTLSIHQEPSANVCKWASHRNVCGASFAEPSELFQHVVEDHIGRKASGNLCLKCNWGGSCDYSCGKRDHIVSHMLIHIDYRPFACMVCGKDFARAPDLRKHQKIHSNIYEDGQTYARKRKPSKTLAIHNLLGTIMDKKLKPEYNQEMAMELEQIARAVMPNVDFMANALNAEPSKNNSDLLQEFDLEEVNNFVVKLYEEIQNTPIDQLTFEPIDIPILNTLAAVDADRPQGEKPAVELTELDQIFSSVAKQEDPLAEMADGDMEELFDKYLDTPDKDDDERLGILMKGFENISFIQEGNNYKIHKRNGGRYLSASSISSLISAARKPLSPRKSVLEPLKSDPTYVVRKLQNQSDNLEHIEGGELNDENDSSVEAVDAGRPRLRVNTKILGKSLSQPASASSFPRFRQEMRSRHLKVVEAIMEELEAVWTRIKSIPKRQ